MKLPRRTFLHLAAGAAALPAVPRIARAQTIRRGRCAWSLDLLLGAWSTSSVA